MMPVPGTSDCGRESSQMPKGKDVRIRSGTPAALNPDDVAWVVEWQLAAAFRWVPAREDNCIRTAPSPDPGGKTWSAAFRAGGAWVEVELPAPDLDRVIRWCYSIDDTSGLLRVPPRVRTSLARIRQSLRRSLGRLDPLRSMGYAMGEAT
jgi:hypothetical protein